MYGDQEPKAAFAELGSTPDEASLSYLLWGCDTIEDVMNLVEPRIERKELDISQYVEIMQKLQVGITVTIYFLTFRTPENLAVIYLEFKQRVQTLEYMYFVKKLQMEKQTVKTLIRLLWVRDQSYQGLHCLPRPICPKT